MSFGVTELVIILVIVMLLFGTSKLKSIGSDLGEGLKGFKTAVKEGQEAAEAESQAEAQVAESTKQEQSESKA